MDTPAISRIPQGPQGAHDSPMSMILRDQHAPISIMDIPAISRILRRPRDQYAPISVWTPTRLEYLDLLPLWKTTLQLFISADVGSRTKVEVLGRHTFCWTRLENGSWEGYGEILDNQPDDVHVFILYFQCNGEKCMIKFINDIWK
jgi:hypothetical protein